MSDLLPEARQVLDYLVNTYTPEARVDEGAIEQATNLHGIAFNDAILDLAAHGLIQMDQTRLRLRAHAWVEAGEDVVGFSVEEDAVAVALAANKVQMDTDDVNVAIEAQALEHVTHLPVDRLNIAVLWLGDYAILSLQQWMSTQPYAFGAVQASYHTRRWLRALGRL